MLFYTAILLYIQSANQDSSIRLQYFPPSNEYQTCSQVYEGELYNCLDDYDNSLPYPPLGIDEDLLPYTIYYKNHLSKRNELEQKQPKDITLNKTYKDPNDIKTYKIKKKPACNTDSLKLCNIANITPINQKVILKFVKTRI